MAIAGLMEYSRRERTVSFKARPVVNYFIAIYSGTVIAVADIARKE